ncbi:MAG: GAF domain-containing protein, partial [Spirulinaceae cyanobacterium SM2_1_0]|nr:GAF domain-containing protein [Spirulinaceae cyanobacterium SM2_1_0]
LPLVLFGLSEAQSTAAINDRHSAPLTPYQQQLWDRFQIQASLAIPVVYQGQWWGVLAVQHCHETRFWQEAERSLLEQVVLEFLLHWQALEGRSQRLQQQMIDRLLAQLSRDLRQHDHQEDVFTTMLAELRRLLRCDRVALYRYDDPCYFWVESVTAGLPFFSETSPPPVLQDLYSPKPGHFSELYAVSDIHQADYTAVQVDLLDRLEIQAHLSVPIRLRDQPWGLLIAYSHRTPRQWNDQERSWTRPKLGNQSPRLAPSSRCSTNANWYKSLIASGPLRVCWKKCVKPLMSMLFSELQPASCANCSKLIAWVSTVLTPTGVVNLSPNR